MLFDPPIPLPYDPALEHLEKGEERTEQGLLETMQAIREKTYADGGHAIRSVHAKSHGLIQGELRVMSDLPRELAQGLFARPGAYPVVMRFSTIPGDLLDDDVSTPRGLAVKVIGVEGARLPGSEGETTQDFTMVNAPSFSAPNAKRFLGSLKLLAGTTDKMEGVKKVLSTVMRGVEAAIESTGAAPNALVSTLGGAPQTHVLGESYYSQAPILYGDYMVKVAVVPVSPELKVLTGRHVDLHDPNGLRDAVIDHFREHGGVWELRVQLAINHHDTPIEDASHPWPEDKTKYLPVAVITATPQTGWSEARSEVVDDRMAFSPWTGLAAHRPLGSIMRVRKAAYEASARFRAEKNGRAVSEPTAFIQLPD